MGTQAVMQAAPPQGVVMQMVMGAWVSKVISDVTRLGVPDIVQQFGPLTAAEMVEVHQIDARPEFLERALRACASLGVFTEDAAGRFGPTPLTDPLTAQSAVSVKKLVEQFGGTWWRIWTGVGEAIARANRRLVRSSAWTGGIISGRIRRRPRISVMP
jgi:hypothetical protein